MVQCTSLILPVAVAGVAAWIASAGIWMAPPFWHGPDIKVLPDEEGMRRSLDGVPPGTYMWPHSHGQAKTPEFQERYSNGPWGNMTVLGGKPNFPANLIVALLCDLIVALVAAVAVASGHGPGTGFSTVFWLAAMITVAVHAIGPLPGGRFLGRSCRFKATEFVDGIVVGVVTAVVLAAIWPSSAA